MPASPDRISQITPAEFTEIRRREMSELPARRRRLQQLAATEGPLNVPAWFTSAQPMLRWPQTSRWLATRYAPVPNLDPGDEPLHAALREQHAHLASAGRDDSLDEIRRGRQHHLARTNQTFEPLAATTDSVASGALPVATLQISRAGDVRGVTLPVWLHGSQLGDAHADRSSAERAATVHVTGKRQPVAVLVDCTDSFTLHLLDLDSALQLLGPTEELMPRGTACISCLPSTDCRLRFRPTTRALVTIVGADGMLCFTPR